MPMMLGALYRALLDAQTPEESARKAAEEVAAYDSRLAAIEARLSLLTWMVGTNVILTLSVLGRLLFIR
jgi:hypothetical protein